MFADLLQRSLDAEFDDEFGSSGYFKKAKRGGKYYWYFRTDGATKSERYVGLLTDKSITDRVNRFKELKSIRPSSLTPAILSQFHNRQIR